MFRQCMYIQVENYNKLKVYSVLIHFVMMEDYKSILTKDE